MKNPRLPYPWLSALLLLVLILYLYATANRSIVTFYHLPIPDMIFIWHWQLAAIALTLSALWFDVHRFYRRQRSFMQDNDRLKMQIRELADSKKQLQSKAHTYSTQTDKLKLFISDRLLEYIEYDEKFLHFKGIAAEVRHNGIICYDKILTALQTARDDNPDNPVFSEALTSLNYLWDLLDLSTADNIALHINNHICECEEYFYQAQLQRSHPEQAADLAPYEPTFLAHNALLRAIVPLMTESDAGLLIDSESHCCHTDLDSPFQFVLEKNAELLGNENHIVLVVENLVKNALFYTAKVKPGHPHSKRYNRVAISLTNTANTTELSVYNHGPHISDDLKEQIFQLGYTTRKAKDQHGRGLGLYFVKEIVNGYEGKISHRNVINMADSFSIRLEFESSGFSGAEVLTEIIDTRIENDQLLCAKSSGVFVSDERLPAESISSAERSGESEDTGALKTIDWKRDRAVKSVEITAKSSGQTHAFAGFEIGETTRIVDPGHAQIPRWALEIQARKRSCKISFIPLDITGVEFVISLPLAESQFDYEEQEIHNASDDYINGIEDKFKPIGA